MKIEKYFGIVRETAQQMIEAINKWIPKYESVFV
jgi:hypothetical protein